MKQLRLALVFWIGGCGFYSPALAKIPTDDLFHLVVQVGERGWINGIRLGFQGLELGKLNLTTTGILYRVGKDSLVAGFGLGYGSDGFANFTSGLYTEYGWHMGLSSQFDFRIDFSSFITSRSGMRSEILTGLGWHF